MAKKLSEIMFEQLDENSTFDDVLAVQNQMIIEDGGPVMPSAETTAEIEKCIAEIKKKEKAQKMLGASTFSV